MEQRDKTRTRLCYWLQGSTQGLTLARWATISKVLQLPQTVPPAGGPNVQTHGPVEIAHPNYRASHIWTARTAVYLPLFFLVHSIPQLNHKENICLSLSLLSLPDCFSPVLSAALFIPSGFCLSLSCCESPFLSLYLLSVSSISEGLCPLSSPLAGLSLHSCASRPHSPFVSLFLSVSVSVCLPSPISRL